MDWLFHTHTLEISKMATDKKFAVAGVSTLEGKTKLRFANDTMRIKILAKNGHKDVELVELPTEMTKAEAVQHLKTIGFGAGNPAVEAAIAYAEKKNPAPKAVIKATVAKTAAVAA
jgi:ribosome maturation protein Sdo1